MSDQSLPVAIIGGGPIGLAAAAHLHGRGEDFILFEAASHVAGNIEEWAHVRMFSSWEYNLDKAAVQLLEVNAWQSPEISAIPTGRQLIDQYLRPLSQIPVLEQRIHYQSKVQGITRLNIDRMKEAGREEAPFLIQVMHQGQLETHLARAVIDATGTWNNPNPAGSSGLPALGEADNKDKIHYGIPNVLGQQQHRFADHKVAVVGGGHSAINVLLNLQSLMQSAPQTELHWILRKPNVEATYGGQDSDELAARGQLGTRIQQMVESGKLQIHTPFFIEEIRQEGDGLQIVGLAQDGRQELYADELIVATGARPDFSFVSELRVELDLAVQSPPALAPMIDPNFHSCGSVKPHGEAELRHPEKDFYMVGMKSYGRAPTFLLATGYEQVRSVVAALAGDWEAAAAVELVLPETGVCGINNWVNPNDFSEQLAPGAASQLAIAEGVACCPPIAVEEVASAPLISVQAVTGFSAKD